MARVPKSPWCVPFRRRDDLPKPTPNIQSQPRRGGLNTAVGDGTTRTPWLHGETGHPDPTFYASPTSRRLWKRPREDLAYVVIVNTNGSPGRARREQRDGCQPGVRLRIRQRRGPDGSSDLLGTGESSELHHFGWNATCSRSPLWKRWRMPVKHAAVPPGTWI